MSNPSYLIVHKDHPLHVRGVNSGAEIATLSLARYLALRGRRVVLAGILADGEQTTHGVEFWDIGDTYSTPKAIARARELGPYHLICTGRAQALVESLDESTCLTRILACHDPSSNATGLSAKTLSRVTDGIVCVSKAQESFFLRDGAPASKVRVIPNGTDHELFAASGPEERDPFKLIFVGALVPDKGIHWLINSFATLKQKFPSLSLDVYGSASLWGREPMFNEKELEATIPGLRFHGAQAQSTVARAFQRAGLCVVPSIWFDSFPLTCIEAQVTGCPVLTFNVGGLPEGVEHRFTGNVLDEISPESLTRGLDEMLSHPRELSAMSQRAIQIQRPKYCWKLVAQRYEEFVLSCRGLAPAFSKPTLSSTQPNTQEEYMNVSNPAQPKISIGIVTYNRVKFLANALDSIAHQTRQPYEIVIVNDGSTDNTDDLLASLRLENLKVTNLPKNVGRPHARNHVVNAVSGDYLLWLDDDDMLPTDAVEAALREIAQNPEADVIYGDANVCDVDMKFLHRRTHRAVNQRELLMNLVYENIIPNPGTITKVSLYKRVGLYNTNFPRSQDYEFWARAALLGANFLYSGRVSCNFRMHPNNLSNPLETKDQSKQQCEIIKTILSQAQLADIFPILDWVGKPTESVAEALSLIARVFFDHGDDLAALEVIEKATEYSEAQSLKIMQAFFLRALARYKEASQIFADVLVSLDPKLSGLNVLVGAPRGSARIAQEHRG